MFVCKGQRCINLKGGQKLKYGEMIHYTSTMYYIWTKTVTGTDLKIA